MLEVLLYLLLGLLNLVLDIVVSLVDVGHLLKTLNLLFIRLLSVMAVEHVEAAWLIQVYRLDFLVKDVALDVLAHVLNDRSLTLHGRFLLGLGLGA